MQPVSEIAFLATYLGMLSTIAFLTVLLLKQNANVVVNVNNPIVLDGDDDDDEIVAISDDDEDEDYDEEIEETNAEEPEAPKEDKKDD